MNPASSTRTPTRLNPNAPEFVPASKTQTQAPATPLNPAAKAFQPGQHFSDNVRALHDRRVSHLTPQTIGSAINSAY